MLPISRSQRSKTVYRIIRRNFGKTFSPLGTALMMAIVRLKVRFFMWLDTLFFPSFRKTGITAPLVIAGNPRSGTTFLHRYLIKSGIGAGCKLRQLLWPSFIMQKMIRPFLPLLERFSPAKNHSAAAHETNLDSAETDDAALLFRYFDGFFLYGFFLAWAEEDLFPWIDPRIRDTSTRDYNWLEQVWIRVLAESGATRIIPKLFSVSVNMPRFLKRFPEARVLYLVRDPLSVIPSGMSLVTGVLDQRFGFWNLPQDRRRHYLNRLYRALVELLLRFHDDWVNERIDRSRVMIVTYPRMMQEFETVMTEILGFIGHHPSPELLQDITERAEAQRNWQSKHTYDLEKFGLTAEQIEKDCALIYSTFLNE